ncbi:MAG TPA: electron transfer flavoprotein subunit beta/FixA family protein [Clostridia bacterium]|nr:electron transfer flavoprotein subunit beta/FixA family protein [Clostridia bacterium]
MGPFKIVVCVKAVPDPKKGSPSFDPVTKTVRRAAQDLVMNLLDRHAVEEALRIRGGFGGKVTVVSMGPPEAMPVLKESLALGVDRAVLLSDRAFAGADTLATSKTLALGIRKLGQFDLVLAGSESSDGATGQVGPQLAEILGIPFVPKAVKIELYNGAKPGPSSIDHTECGEGVFAMVTGEVECGLREYRVRLPALFTVSRKINEPKGVTMMGILGSRGKEVEVLGAADIGASPGEVGAKGSPTLIRAVEGPPPGRQGEIISGDPDEAVRALVEKLRAKGVLV